MDTLSKEEQLELADLLVARPAVAAAPISRRGNGAANKLDASDRVAHDWYRFVLSYPPHLVREYLHKFGIQNGQTVLDPFCGTGTTLVECKKLGIESMGIEANPMAHFASRVKLDWSANPAALISNAGEVARIALEELEASGIQDEPFFQQPRTFQLPDRLRTLPPDLEKLLLTGSISPLPLHKTLVLRDAIRERSQEEFRAQYDLALAKAVVNTISNLHFGPEVGVGPAKQDTPVVSAWLSGVCAMARDIENLRRTTYAAGSIVHRADARELCRMVQPGSIDAVITSPPYPNEKDYTRTTRLESVLLEFIRSKRDLQALKRTLVRSNTRGVYKEADDHRWIAGNTRIAEIAAAIEARRLELGKSSGFERMYARATTLYFGGMARHFSELRTLLRPGAQLAYVVGDQASYLRVLIRTGQLLAEIAQGLGYELVGIDLFRTRLATATREQLREEVVLLRWP